MVVYTLGVGAARVRFPAARKFEIAAVAQWQSAALKRLASGVRFTPAAH